MYVLIFQIGFVIPQELVPGRMALLMIIFLNLLTMSTLLSRLDGFLYSNLDTMNNFASIFDGFQPT